MKNKDLSKSELKYQKDIAKIPMNQKNSMSRYFDFYSIGSQLGFNFHNPHKRKKKR